MYPLVTRKMNLTFVCSFLHIYTFVNHQCENQCAINKHFSSQSVRLEKSEGPQKAHLIHYQIKIKERNNLKKHRKKKKKKVWIMAMGT